MLECCGSIISPRTGTKGSSPQKEIMIADPRYTRSSFSKHIKQTVEVLKSFLRIVEMCHRKGMCGIPGFVVADHHKLSIADYVLPLLCVHSGSRQRGM